MEDLPSLYPSAINVSDAPYVYLDYAASTPLRSVAQKALAAYYELPCSVANPSSLHTLGRQAAQTLEAARTDCLLPVKGVFRSNEVTFCGGGTEAINLAVTGIAQGVKKANPARNKIFISSLEHDAVYDLINPLKQSGFDVFTIPALANGLLDLSFLESRLDQHTALVCVMAANNETGVVQEIGAIAQLVHAVGGYLFVDCIQAFLKTPLPYDAIDSFVIAGHKLGAPQGIAALFLKRSVPYAPQVFGGGQERGRRPGTQNVPGAIALGKTIRYLFEHKETILPLLEKKTAAVQNALFRQGTNIFPTVDSAQHDAVPPSRVPGIVSVYVAGIDSETLILALDAAGFGVSAASACTQINVDGSRILRAMGFSNEDAASSLRISFDERVSDADLDAFCIAFVRLVQELPKYT